MSVSKIKVHTPTVRQAGVDMGFAANTTHEVLGSVAAAAQPVTVATFGEPHLTSVFEHFWTALRQQVQLSGDVFAELGKRMGGAAVKLDNGDIQNANAINGVGNNTPATHAPATTSPPAGADNNPTPVVSAPAPPGPTTPQDPSTGGGDVNGGTIDTPGSATGV